MKILIKYKKDYHLLDWIDFDFFPKSNGEGKEIYLRNNEGYIEEMILLFYSIFGDLKNEIIIYNNSWWDFCINTWDPGKDKYDYEIYNKPDETKEYLQMLKESQIPIDYTGFCICTNWDKFLLIILKCITSHQAPYSPMFCDIKNNFFFYFHYSGSIGLYYKNFDSKIQQLLHKAEKNYDLK